MMKVIFESETEVGKCNGDRVEPRRRSNKDNAFVSVLAHTQASLNGHGGMLKIEQHCYLRRGREIPDQPWIQPEIIFEPGVDSKPQMIELAKNLHARFVDRVRHQFPEPLLPN